MTTLTLILLVLTIPNAISSEAPFFQTRNNSTTMWSCRNCGNFPTHLYNASTVERLGLRGNDDNLPQLEKLTSNDLQLYKLPNLVELVLFNYTFEEVERGAFQNAGKLVNLTLLMNSLKKLDPQVFRDVPNLQMLGILSTDLEDFENSEFPSLKNLTELFLSSVGIRSLKPTLLKNLKSLQILDLSHNRITILDDREVFRPLKNLKILNFQRNPINFVDPEVFADLQNLKILDLSFNNLHEGFKNGTQFHNPNLIELDLKGCQLINIAEDLFQNLRNLKVLLLAYNHLSHIPQKMFSSLKNLETLSLRGNSIETLELDTFSDLGNLRSLDLELNEIESLDWKVVRPLKKLSTFHLDWNPWQCNCQVLYLRKFFIQRNIDFNEGYWVPSCKTFVANGEPTSKDVRGSHIEWKDIKPEELNCHVSPNITKLSADKKPKLGESLNLQCDFSGDLPLQVIWMKDKVILRNFTLSEEEPLQNNRTLMEHRDELIIKNFKEENAGLYKVVVSNEGGETEKSEYLELLKEPSTMDSADNTEQDFLHFLQSILEVMF